MTRKVLVYEWFKPEGAKFNQPYEKKLIGNGIFHQFGCNYEEFDSGAGNFSTAIVEMPDGNVINIDVGLIVFTRK